MSMLEFIGVSKSFGKIKVLDKVSFSVEKGEFVFITGPSGSGKTTIIKLVLKEFPPDEGKILFDGQDVTKIPNKKTQELRRKIGTIFQDYKVLPEKTVEENIEIALGAVGFEEKKWDELVRKVLTQVELGGKEDFFPSQLSGGEVQRVCIARALAINPLLILADEPTGNLDWETADRVTDIFEKINGMGKTVVMATHHQFLVEKHLFSQGGRIKRKVITLSQGRIVNLAQKKRKGRGGE
jgi:cell division transport system ATP-binding protein